MFRLTYTIHSGITKTNDTTHLNNEIHTRPSAFITRKLVNKWILAGLLACSILETFPFLIGTVALRVVEDTFRAHSSGVCSGFSPDSLFTHHSQEREMSTKIRYKDTHFFYCV